MVVIYGTRNYGTIQNEDGSLDATQFFHIYYLPLIPTGSAYEGRSLAWRSVLVAYARIWGIIALIATLAYAIGGLDHAVTRSGVLAATVPPLLVAWVVAAAWLWIGKRPDTNAGFGLKARMLTALLVPLALFMFGTVASFGDLEKNQARLSALGD